MLMIRGLIKGGCLARLETFSEAVTVEECSALYAGLNKGVDHAVD